MLTLCSQKSACNFWLPKLMLTGYLQHKQLIMLCILYIVFLFIKQAREKNVTFFFFKFIWRRERMNVSRGGAEREGGRKFQAGSSLSAQSLTEFDYDLSWDRVWWLLTEPPRHPRENKMLLNHNDNTFTVLHLLEKICISAPVQFKQTTLFNCILLCDISNSWSLLMTHENLANPVKIRNTSNVFWGTNFGGLSLLEISKLYLDVWKKLLLSKE